MKARKGVSSAAVIGLLFASFCSSACGGDPQGFAATDPATSVEGSQETPESVAEVHQATVSSSWLVATAGTGLNTVTGDRQLGTDSTSNFAVEVLVHGVRGLRVAPTTGTPNLIGGYSGNNVTSGAVGATIAGGGTASNVNSVTDDYGFVGGGQLNQAGVAGGTTSDGAWAFVGGGKSNSAAGAAATIAGGDHNSATQYDTFIGGGASNAASAIVTTIGGGSTNQATAEFATIGGGDTNTASGTHSSVLGGKLNTAGGSFSSVGGGWQNSAGTDYSTVAGGDNNTASSYGSAIGGGESNHIADTATFGTIAGGNVNTVGGYASVVGGGFSNTADPTVNGGTNAAAVLSGYRSAAIAESAVVVGGGNNLASGTNSVVIGGNSNTASGAGSLAGGQGANANSNGCFVWADDSNHSAVLNCGIANKFVARAAGGVVFFSNSAASLGVILAANATSWAAISDRNAKRDIAPVNPQDVLRRFAAMPVYHWVYKDDEQRQKHMGPMAQDFHAAFGLGGDDDKHISTLDADGVMFGAIQGLNEKVTKLEADNAALRVRLDRLEARAPLAAGVPLSPYGFIAVGFGLAAALTAVRSRRGTRN